MRSKLIVLATAALVSAALAPASANAIKRVPPPPHCDPMACPDPTSDVRDILLCLALYDGELGSLPTSCIQR